MEEQQDPTEPTELGFVIPVILDRAKPKSAPKERKEARLANPDIQYMTAKYGLEPKFIARALRSFGEPVVLESLRRWERGWMFEKDRARAVFWRICQAVESVGKEG
jgi:hypothetical protein